MTDDPAYWRFYCYRCEQWTEAEGPWCDLYRSEPLTSPCVFDENPGWSGGVPFSYDPDRFRALEGWGRWLRSK